MSIFITIFKVSFGETDGEQELILRNEVGVGGYTKDSFGRLALTPEGQRIRGMENISDKNIVLEDESRTIGRAGLPGFWYEKMQVSKLVVLKISTEQRIKNILEEYVIRELNNSHKILEQYLTALEKIKKRLGDMLFKEISGLMISGFNNNDITSHEDWILKLLTKYYDPMYNYKLESRRDYIVHIGDNISCLKYLKSI